MKFKMPTKSNLKSRMSTISNAYAISITPYIKPTQEEIDSLLSELDVKVGQCAYCLRAANTTDHFRPLVKDGLPNGFISDINNLVPCCSVCNSSKGKKDWNEWYLSEKNIKRLLSLGLTREDISYIYSRLKIFANRTVSDRIDYQSILGEEKWQEFKQHKTAIHSLLKSEQAFCDELMRIIEEKISKK